VRLLSNPIIVETIHVPHPQIRAEDFRSPLVRRLINTDTYRDDECDLEASHLAEGSNEQVVRKTKFRWSGLEGDFKKVVKTYQAPVITEFATLGLACGLVTSFTGREITEVTRRGEKSDYWLGDKELMLEVSGLQSGNLDDLCVSKADQLRENPFDKDGYVCVAVYSKQEARLWYYPADEDQQ
jgi:hypothetical protein